MQIEVTGEAVVKLTDAGQAGCLDVLQGLVTRDAKEIIDRSDELIFGAEHAGDPPGLNRLAGSEFAERGAITIDALHQVGRLE